MRKQGQHGGRREVAWTERDAAQLKAQALGRVPKRRKAWEPTEDQLQVATAEYLDQLPDDVRTCDFVWHWTGNEDRDRRSREERAADAARGEQPGAGDWCLSWRATEGRPGGSAFIELKTAGGRLSAKQEAFRRWCHRCDIPYVVARSLDEFEMKLLALGLIRRPHLHRQRNNKGYQNAHFSHANCI